MSYTHGDKNLHTLLVKHFNDLLNGQRSEKSIGKVTFYVGNLFCIHLGTKYANFLEKIFAEISGKKCQNFSFTNRVFKLIWGFVSQRVYVIMMF